MKSILPFLLLFFIVACSSTKPITKTSEKEKIVKTEPKPITDNEVVKKTPQKENILQNLKQSPITKQVAIVKSIKVKKNDTIDSLNTRFKQNVTKRIDTNSHFIWNELLNKYVSENGNVNYSGFKKDNIDLTTYLDYLSENLPKNDWQKNQKLAYWINAYNAMTVDLILRNYPVKSIKNIKNPWKQRLWKLGDKWYNLNEIEHQILRKMNEPRIHFAIVCASYSCPKLENEAFQAKTLDEQLIKATKEFLADNTRNEIASNEVKLSKIFQWYAKDFKENGTVIDFINQYSEIKISAKAKKSFKIYNWDLND